MHTSTRLATEDFSYSRGAEAASFGAFCPDYHPQDRTGVVSLGLEDGVLHTSYALLAFTTTFYDHLRARQTPFFDYPQHFAFVGASEQTSAIHVGSDLLPAGTPQLWNAWSWLDVWPANKWLTAPPTATAMIQRVFDYQINRLFWPRTLTPQARTPTNDGTPANSMMANGNAQGTQPPGYLWKMLATGLKAVYLYGPEAEGDSPWGDLPAERIELRAQAAAQEIVQESLVQLPAPLLMSGSIDQARHASASQCYTRVPVAGFLAALGAGALSF